jgi:two-component system, NtrC family, sensor kinase
MTFRKKLLLAFGVMIVPLGIIGAQTLWNLRQETVALRTLEESLARARVFADIESVIYRKLRKVRDYLTGWDPQANDDFERLDSLLHPRIAEWKRAAGDPDDLRLAGDLERLDGRIDAVVRRAVALYRGGQRAAASGLIQDELNRRILPELDATIKAIYTTSRTHNIARAFRNLQATERSTTMVLIVIVVSSAVFGALFAVLIARALARPVAGLKTMMEMVGRGEFDQARAVEIRSRDELGGLARQFVAMAERLQRAHEGIIQAEKLASLGQMSAAVAHGLRNPLASIRAATQLALHQLPARSPQREHLQAVIAEVDRLEKRIAHLLDFTKPVGFSPVAERLATLVDRVVAVFAEKLGRQGITVTVDVSPRLPEAWVDAFQIEQAFLEVVSNALEAMPRGGTLAIGATRVADGAGGARLRVTVRDTGEGIPAAALARVAEPFFTTKADGTGLGLAIAKRFVEQNAGALTIVSREREGTVVTITLPASVPDAVPAA